MTDLSGRRILVVGASSGIGAAVAALATDRGARVAGAARRVDRIAADVPIACDVRDEQSCAATVQLAATKLGGLDAVIYATGASPMRRIEDMTRDDWDDVLHTNAVGASLITAAALPHLLTSRGCAVYLSSDSAPNPLHGLGAYAASKSTLETIVSVWAREHPGLRFVTHVVGPTLTGFADGWDMELAAEMMQRWGEVRQDSAIRRAEDVAAEVLDHLDPLD